MVVIRGALNLLKSSSTADTPYFIVTLDAKGILAKMKNDIYFLSLDKVDTKNPIASGDFFLGGLVKYITLGEEPLITLKKAISYATANVLNWYPELKTEQLQQIYNAIKVEKF